MNNDRPLRYFTAHISADTARLPGCVYALALTLKAANVLDAKIKATKYARKYRAEVGTIRDGF